MCLRVRSLHYEFLPLCVYVRTYPDQSFTPQQEKGVRLDAEEEEGRCLASSSTTTTPPTSRDARLLLSPSILNEQFPKVFT